MRILPFIQLEGEEELRRQKLCAQFNFNEPWNSPHNRKLTATPMEIYVCPKHAKSWGSLPTTTSYVAVVGPGTAWEEPTDGDTRSPPDGELLMIVEVENSGIEWAEPKDLTLSEALRGINIPGHKGISSPHSNRINAVNVDGHTLSLRPDISTDELRLLLTGKAGKPKVQEPVLPP